MLTRDQILQADDLRHVDVDVPEWGGTIRIRTMTGKERQKYQGIVADAKGKMPADFMETFISLCAIDEKGKALFADGDVKALGEKSAVALNRVFEAALALNGTTDKGVEDIRGE